MGLMLSLLQNTTKDEICTEYILAVDRLAIVQTVDDFFSKPTHHTKKKLSSLIALLLFQTSAKTRTSFS